MPRTYQFGAYAVEIEDDLIFGRFLSAHEELSIELVKTLWDFIDPILAEKARWYFLTNVGQARSIAPQVRKYHIERARRHRAKLGASAFVCAPGPTFLLLKLMLRGAEIAGQGSATSIFESESDARAWLEQRRKQNRGGSSCT